MVEDHVFLAKDGLCLGFSFLHSEEGHFFEGGLVNGSLPEVRFLPDLALIDLWHKVHQFFGLFLVPIEGEDQTKNTLDNEDIIFLLAFFDNNSEYFAADPCVFDGPNDQVMLQSVFFNEHEGDQAIKMMLLEISFKCG